MVNVLRFLVKIHTSKVLLRIISERIKAKTKSKAVDEQVDVKTERGTRIKS